MGCPAHIYPDQSMPAATRRRWRVLDVDGPAGFTPPARVPRTTTAVRQDYDQAPESLRADLLDGNRENRLEYAGPWMEVVTPGSKPANSLPGLDRRNPHPASPHTPTPAWLSTLSIPDKAARPLDAARRDATCHLSGGHRGEKLMHFTAPECGPPYKHMITRTAAAARRGVA